MTIAGMFFLVDPLRPGVGNSVEKLRKAGISTRMCTGDQLDTAKAIAVQAKIIT